MQMQRNQNGVDAIDLSRPRRARIAATLCSLIAAALLFFASAAGAADRIYWSNDGCCNGSGSGGGIAFANLDGSGGGSGNLNTGSALVQRPMGLAIDSAAGRIYWANWGDVIDDPGQPDNEHGTGMTIGWANLDGSGGGTLTVTGTATVTGPHGIAIDPVARKLYWTNVNNNTIDVSNLDGSGSAVLNTTGATVDQPRGLAIDPTTQRIYWANWAEGTGTTISYASLNGTGGANLMTSAVTVDGPEGVAIDQTANRIYWGNFSNQDTISYVPLSGGSAQNLTTTGATVDNAHGVAIDPTAGMIYWPNFYNNVIARAHLNGSGGDDFLTASSVSPASMDNPDLPVILKAPSGAGTPTVSGGTTTGSVLSCTQGSWAADIIASLLYRAPHTYGYQWSRDGTDIPSATGTTVTANIAGAYRCRVTASNAAGGSSQTSNPHTVTSSTPAPTVSGLNPTHGTSAGGNQVTITGTNLTGALGVNFGSNAASAVNVVGPTTITANAPAGAAGSTVDVTVSTAGGTSSTGGSGNNYVYDAVQSLLGGDTGHSGTPSNEIRLGRLIRDKGDGTATLRVGVPGPGVLTLSDHMATWPPPRSSSRVVATRAVHRRGRVKIQIRAVGRASSRLDHTGRVWVKVKVGFTPTGGTRATIFRVVELKKQI
jgi:DNA-binding beta-propeller fold protein YncE